MQIEAAEQLIRGIEDFFRDEQTKLNASLEKGLSIEAYRFQDAIRQALQIALGILETFNDQREKYCATEEVRGCLNLLQDRCENRWKGLPRNDHLQRAMAGIGFLAADMGLPTEAETLFNLLAQLSPENIYPMLGLAYSKITAGAAHQALDVIRDGVLNLAPDSDLGLAFLALAYDRLNRTEEALAAASAVITANRDESAVVLAREVQRELGHPVAAENMA